eukprot:GFUD01020395.1.p1 GENE.GFUD01020395.1~~GFUD01020395.1.p1  ORF type:complete len:150 (+),score=20.11 GFUD01020395.1:85-534(+)
MLKFLFFPILCSCSGRTLYLSRDQKTFAKQDYSHDRSLTELRNLNDSHDKTLAELIKLNESHVKTVKDFHKRNNKYDKPLEDFRKLNDSHDKTIADFRKLKDSHYKTIADVSKRKNNLEKRAVIGEAVVEAVLLTRYSIYIVFFLSMVK